MIQKCNRTDHAHKVRALLKARSRVPADLRPLFNHILRLSNQSVRVGYCQRAGRELRAARKLLR